MRELLNYKLIVAYDGTAYKGWQDNHIAPSIEGALKAVIEQIQQHHVQLLAASRTDAGVHAEGQVVTFEAHVLRKEPNEFLLSLNALLPPDIRVISIENVPTTFHPTLDAQSKEYHYRLCFGPILMPLQRWTTWHFPTQLNVDLMQEAAACLVGNHDFSAFCNELAETNYTDTYRTLYKVEIEQQESNLLFKCVGANFMYRMVRNLVGTLVYVGNGKISLQDFKGLLKGKDRTHAGITAPAHGLTLFKVRYL